MRTVSLWPKRTPFQRWMVRWTVLWGSYCDSFPPKHTLAASVKKVQLGLARATRNFERFPRKKSKSTFQSCCLSILSTSTDTHVQSHLHWHLLTCGQWPDPFGWAVGCTHYFKFNVRFCLYCPVFTDCTAGNTEPHYVLQNCNTTLCACGKVAFYKRDVSAARRFAGMRDAETESL